MGVEKTKEKERKKKEKKEKIWEKRKSEAFNSVTRAHQIFVLLTAHWCSFLSRGLDLWSLTR